MSLWWCPILLFLGILSFNIPSLQGDDEFEGLSHLNIEHSFDHGSDPVFVKRGTITISSMTNNLAQFIQAEPLSENERRKLQDLARENGVYRIRVPVKVGGPLSGNPSLDYVSTFIRACSMYESLLSDEITLNVDPNGNVIGVSITTNPAVCVGRDMDLENLKEFNTTVDIRQTIVAPVPDTQSYIEKIENEKAQKAKGEQGDNRSFFAKYWMYIVPVVIFLMIASNADQGGGGGR
ncbi:ER membrane protein complex subunit 10-like [Lineus longissimus]|uniref:ER membrane protein complex subunit 10-like n=1 Tax=Lineus longissimus TaxID=88925 RepID=UPI002B4E6985